jgi:hypothetical protein
LLQTDIETGEIQKCPQNPKEESPKEKSVAGAPKKSWDALCIKKNIFTQIEEGKGLRMTHLNAYCMMQRDIKVTFIRVFFWCPLNMHAFLDFSHSNQNYMKLF